MPARVPDGLLICVGLRRHDPTMLDRIAIGMQGHTLGDGLAGIDGVRCDLALYVPTGCWRRRRW